MSINNFHYAITLALILYDIEGDTDELEEIGLVAYNFIGNKNTKLFKVVLDVNCEDGSVELPCNCDIIEAVTYCGPEDWNYTDNTKNNGDPMSFYSENYIENLKVFTDPYYISGKFVKYKRVNNTLYINKGYDKVIVLYHGIVLDDEGLPLINDKEAVAIADFIAYTVTYKKSIKTNNPELKKTALDFKQLWLFHCDAARTPEYISQEKADMILNAKSSWGRKVYNKSYKPIM